MRGLFTFAAGAAIAAAVATVSQAAVRDQVGAWDVAVRGGGAGRAVTTAILMAPDGASLIAACDARGIDVVVSYIDALPKTAEVAVQWRLDGGPLHRQAWQEGSDHSSLSPGGAETDAAVWRQIARGRTLNVAAAGRRSTFDLTGAPQVAKLIGECAPQAPVTASPPAGAEEQPAER